MPVLMSPNPKIIRKFINGNGTTFDGGVDEALGKPVAGLHISGPRRAEGLRGAEEATATPKKICLECSSPAVDGFDYCSFCKQYK